MTMSPRRANRWARSRGSQSQPCIAESPSSWLTAEQNALLGTRGPERSSADVPAAPCEVVLDGNAGWKTIEIFVVIVPVGWG